jgi:mannan endo-1,4-beta-mannosidase
MRKILLPVILFLLNSALGFAQGFKISGTDLKDANGNTFIMKGINVPLAWYVSQSNSNIAAIREVTGANCLRIVVQTNTADNAWQTAVQKCIENKMIPMVELHDVTGLNDTVKLHDMAEWWSSKADFLTRPDISRYILINIANEWSNWNLASPNHEPSSSWWRDAYFRCIQTLRNAGIKTTLVVDAAAYGQDNKVNVLLKYGQEVFNSDPEKNILFSIHMYCEWAKNGNSSVSTHLPAVRNAGLPVIVGEFGFQHANGPSDTCDIDEQLIIKTCQENNIGWLAWSWIGNSTEVAYLDLAEEWDGSKLTSWGQTVVNGQNGTKTAVTASVFGTSSNKYPTVSITAPETGSKSASGAPVTITASAEDADGQITKVEFYNGGYLLFSDTEAPYTYSWTGAADGLYTLIAVAYDNENGVGSSSPVKIRLGEEPVLPNILTNGEFDNDTTGWGIYNTGTANGQFSVVTGAGMSGNNALKICSTNPGTENWYVQVTQPAPFVAGKKYEISFIAKADTARAINIGLQQEGDKWTTHYGQYIELTASPQLFTFTFEPTVSDETARLKFLTGLNNTCVYLDKVVFNEVVPVTDFITTARSASQLSAYPNPFENSVRIISEQKLSGNLHLNLISMNGEKIYEGELSGNTQEIFLPEYITSGIYTLILTNGEKQQVVRIEKK